MGSYKSHLADFDATLVHETNLAVLLRHSRGETWLLKSVVQDNRDGTWTTPEEICLKKGII